MSKSAGKKFKFGDQIVNLSAGDRNPIKYGIYVRTVVRNGRLNPGRWVELTDGKGRFWQVHERSCERVSVNDSDCPQCGEATPELAAR